VTPSTRGQTGTTLLNSREEGKAENFSDIVPPLLKERGKAHLWCVGGEGIIPCTLSFFLDFICLPDKIKLLKT